MTVSLADTEKPKRTRTNVKQSKYGCFTCKARRIKCDEAKPACQRCQSSKRECQGYPRGAFSDSPHETQSTTLLVPLSTSPSSSTSSSTLSCTASPLAVLSFDPYHLSSPFVILACGVLVRSPRRGRSNIEQSFWTQTVPQLVHTIPSVRAAAEAFGASYSEYVLQVDHSCSALETTKRYTRALRLVQHDLATLQHGPIPCIIACLFLAFFEAIQQKLDEGLLHLLGAFSVMLSRTDKKLLADVDTESLSLLLQKLDLHVATYGVCHPPELPQLPPVTANIVESLPPDQALFKILHSCYHFDAQAFTYKYTTRRAIPPEMLIEQGRQLATLKLWLSHNQLPPVWDANWHESLVVLRSQCLTALVHTATILEPRETGYDCYGPEFQEVITTIEALFLDRDLQVNQLSSTFGHLPSFIPEMGIMHPLYYAAKKYRNAFWRRRALNLILRSGKEGPWCSKTEGPMIEVVIRIEEGQFDRASLDLSTGEDPVLDSFSNIPERSRINACWPIDPDAETREATRFTKQKFSKGLLYRCIDVERLLADDEAQRPRSWAWLESPWWEEWTEPLEEIG
ncbi:transcriptional regulatory [Fusarium sporotrichioides]|uniref:Transcriptional regulatory n=1 Tax=Fusarium sporotrichioides TaxID=5514 RepID=A0A395SAN8_FUSSP|nr:transcriptional regulatory [Fusarium sporotrichioides]